MAGKVLKARDRCGALTNASLISQHCSMGFVYGKKKKRKKKNEPQIFIQLWQKFKKVPVQPALMEERVFQSIMAFIYLCGHVCPVSSGGRATPSHTAVWDRADRQMKGSDLALLNQQYDTHSRICVFDADSKTPITSLGAKMTGLDVGARHDLPSDASFADMK